MILLTTAVQWMEAGVCGESGARAARLVAAGGNSAPANVTALRLRTKANNAPEMEMNQKVATAIYVLVSYTEVCNDVNVLIT